MSTTTIFTTTRDQIALDIYIRALLTRSGHSKEECAKVAYQAADVFIAEQTRQNETPQLPALPAEERKTVPPVVGHRFYMRNGQTVLIEPITREHTSYHLPDGRHNLNPQYDLVSEYLF